MDSLKGKRVTVAGLGLHGGALGTIEWLVGQGARVTVTDLKTKEQLKPTLGKLEKYLGITFVLGEHRRKDFTNADMIIRNPAVPKNSEFLQAAREAGVPIEMDSSLFFLYSPSKDIVGITGSKGKTTAANAISTVLQAHSTKTVAVGIDGISPLGELPRVQPDSPVVFELSSWRLEALAQHQLSPPVAVVTSIYKEHLNTYSSFDEYIATKQIIVRYQKKEDIAILNRDNEALLAWQPVVQSRLFWFTIGDLPEGNGIFIRSGKVVIRTNEKEEELFPVANLPLRYEHEKRNILPAILMGHLRGMPASEITRALQKLRALPHRLEEVAQIKEVTYINDSAATMPDATIAALDALQGQTLVHIIGGSDKKLEFEKLAKRLAAASIRALVWLPGTATERMKETIRKKVDVSMIDASSMQDAVEKASQLAQTGDTVLLSPGATSFGLFQHEFDRGNQFREAVKKKRPNR